MGKDGSRKTDKEDLAKIQVGNDGDWNQSGNRDVVKMVKL